LNSLLGEEVNRSVELDDRRGVAGFTMKSVLFGLSPTDPLTLGSVIVDDGYVARDSIAGMAGIADRSKDGASV
jgi:hypothetical protein